MILKIIHSCWFGRNPLPPLAERCIASWRKFLPDYEIKEWNEDNFDVNIVPYTVGAYAFVSDYAQFVISSGFSFKAYIKKFIPESLLLVFSDIKRRLKDR